MAPPATIHVHLAADGGICVVGPGQSSAWVTLDELRQRLTREPGIGVELSGDPSAPPVRPAKQLLDEVAGTISPGPAPAETVRPNGGTALMAAAAYGALHLLDDLIDRGAALEDRDIRRLTPLHHAAVRGQTEAVSRLLDAGADIEARTVEGKSPLWNAAAFGHAETVRLLLDRGADPLALGADEVDARGWAAVRGHDDVVALLPAGTSLVQVDDSAIGIRHGGSIPRWYVAVFCVLFLLGVALFGGRRFVSVTGGGTGSGWDGAIWWTAYSVALVAPMFLFFRGERGEVPSLVVDDDAVEVAGRRGQRQRVRLADVTAAAVEPSSSKPRRIRLEHPGGTTIVPLAGRPAVAVIELLHRRLGELGTPLTGGWHLAFTDGSVDPVMQSSDLRPGRGRDRERE